MRFYLKETYKILTFQSSRKIMKYLLNISLLCDRYCKLCPGLYGSESKAIQSK